MQFIINYMPLMIFIAFAIEVLVTGLKFNITTYRIDTMIRKISAAEGKEWSLYGNISRMFLLVLSPNDLIEESDSPSIMEAKQQLIKHRMTMKKTLLQSILRIVAIFGIGIGLIFMAIAA